MPSKRSSRASMADVARLAGVSAQTVSRVSTGSPLVHPETRQRVMEAMAQVGYTPNVAARALRSGSFGTIGVIAHRLSRTGESRTVEAVVNAARAADRTVTLLDIDSTSHADVSEAASRLSHQAIDGLIIIRAEIEDADSLILPVGLPAVVADATFGGRLPMVGADHAGGARAVVEHLLSLGHTTVHHVAGPPNSIPARARLTAWRETLEAHGAPVPEPLQGDWSPASGGAAGLAIAARDDVTAVFCANDEMAAGLMVAFSGAGVRVPQDISVAGFDDIPLAPYLTAPLTTARQPFAELGTHLVDRLLARVGRDAHAVMREDRSARAELIPCPLVVRSSTAAPR